MFAKLFGGARPAPAKSTNRFQLGVTRLETRENPAGPLGGGPGTHGGYDPLVNPDPAPELDPDYYVNWDRNPNNPNFKPEDNYMSDENMFKTSQAMFDRWQVVLHTFVGPPSEQLMPTPQDIANGFY